MTSANQRRIILHSILAGLTPLIPIPFLDDVGKSYFTHATRQRGTSNNFQERALEFNLQVGCSFKSRPLRNLTTAGNHDSLLPEMEQREARRQSQCSSPHATTNLKVEL